MQQGHARFLGIAALRFVAGIGIPLMATLKRVLGIAVMGLGVYLARKPV